MVHGKAYLDKENVLGCHPGDGHVWVNIMREDVFAVKVIRDVAIRVWVLGSHKDSLFGIA